MHEHPLQRFFKSLRERPVFAWERFQMRDVLVIDHPLCQAVFSRQGAQLLHFQPVARNPGCGARQVAAGRRHSRWRAGVLAVVWPSSQRKRVAVPWLGAVDRLEAARQQHR
jgi:D-hexose-6-phosphate mutarotase